MKKIGKEGFVLVWGRRQGKWMGIGWISNKQMG